jgi:tRNA1Val (adenine37-N6)-methyltransferase
MSVFHFKHFSVRQTNSAMKVGTDAMLLGSLCQFHQPKQLLDIGTGTGVLSLMIAQRFQPQKITAIEIEPEAASDAAYNFALADFRVTFELIQHDIRTWQTDQLFDGIVSNPPFFEQSSKSTSQQRNLARHTDDLPFDDLMRIGSELLVPDGKLWMIAPTAALPVLESAGLSDGLFLQQIIHIHGKPETAVRIVLCFGKTDEALQESTFTIRNSDGSYTNEYIALTKDFHGVDLSLSNGR